MEAHATLQHEVAGSNSAMRPLFFLFVTLVFIISARKLVKNTQIIRSAVTHDFADLRTSWVFALINGLRAERQTDAVCHASSQTAVMHAELCVAEWYIDSLSKYVYLI